MTYKINSLKKLDGLKDTREYANTLHHAKDRAAYIVSHFKPMGPSIAPAAAKL